MKLLFLFKLKKKLFKLKLFIDWEVSLSKVYNCKGVIYNYIFYWLYFMTKKYCNCFNFVPYIL